MQWTITKGRWFRDARVMYVANYQPCYQIWGFPPCSPMKAEIEAADVLKEHAKGSHPTPTYNESPKLFFFALPLNFHLKTLSWPTQNTFLDFLGFHIKRESIYQIKNDKNRMTQLHSLVLVWLYTGANKRLRKVSPMMNLSTSMSRTQWNYTSYTYYLTKSH